MLLPKEPEEISHHEVIRALQDVLLALGLIEKLCYDQIGDYDIVPEEMWKLGSTVTSIRERLFKEGRYR